MKISMSNRNTAAAFLVGVAAALTLGAFDVPAAQGAPYCRPMRELEEAVGDCYENSEVAEAAVTCLQGFEKSVEKSSRRLAAGLLKPAQASRQRDSQRLSRTDYGLTTEALDALINEGEARLRETQAFREGVVFPEDADDDNLSDQEFQQLLRGSECYRDNVEVIDHVKLELARQLRDLKAARAASAGKGGVSGEREAAGASMMNRVTGGKAGAAPKPVRGERLAKESDITGTEEDRRKRESD